VARLLVRSSAFWIVCSRDSVPQTRMPPLGARRVRSCSRRAPWTTVAPFPNSPNPISAVITSSSRIYQVNMHLDDKGSYRSAASTNDISGSCILFDLCRFGTNGTAIRHF
jgi:hypothetical protein